MYRSSLKSNPNDTYVNTIGKDSRSALLFSMVSLLLNNIEQSNNLVNISGLTLNLGESFVLRGIFCAIAISYGLFAFLGYLGAMLTDAGIFGNKRTIRRIVAYSHNHFRFNNPTTTKKAARFLFRIVAWPMLIIVMLFLALYLIGVFVSIDELGKLFLHGFSLLKT